MRISDWSSDVCSSDRRGSPEELIPFGIESLMVMRIEKGFLHVGSDTDGATMPQDVGFARVMANKESDFVGRRSTMTPEGRRENRKQLVGLEALDAQTRIPVGGHVVDASFKAIPVRSQGWVPSAAMRDRKRPRLNTSHKCSTHK